MKNKIGILGCGQLGQRFLESFLEFGKIPATTIFVSHPKASRRKNIEKTFGVTALAKNADLLKHSETIFLCIKPQKVEQVLPELQGFWSEKHILASNLAGTSIETLKKLTSPALPILRLMPNICIAQGTGLIPFVGSQDFKKTKLNAFQKYFSFLGTWIPLQETQMNAATGLSGSGPAFVFLIAEALIDAGVKVGLTRAQSRTMAEGLLAGAATMLQNTGLHPSVLKEWVTSPAGTAIAGLHTLEAGKLRNTLIDAVESATSRAKELSQL